MAVKTDYKKILLSLGFKADQLPAEEVEKEIDYDETGRALHDALIVSIENNPSVQKKLSEAAFGRVAGEVQRKLIKKFGLQFENQEDGQILDKVIDAAHATVKTQASKTAQEIQQQLIDKEQEIIGLRDAHAKELEAERGKVTAFKRNVNFERVVHTGLNKLNNPEKKIKLSAPVEVSLPFVKQELENRYSIVYENDAIELRRKDKPEMKVTDGAKVLTIDDAIQKIADENNLIAKVEEKKKQFSFAVEGVSEVSATSEGMKKIQQRTAAN